MLDLQTRPTISRSTGCRSHFQPKKKTKQKRPKIKQHLNLPPFSLSRRAFAVWPKSAKWRIKTKAKAPQYHVTPIRAHNERERNRTSPFISKDYIRQMGSECNLRWPSKDTAGSQFCHNFLGGGLLLHGHRWRVGWRWLDAGRCESFGIWPLKMSDGSTTCHCPRPVQIQKTIPSVAASLSGSISVEMRSKIRKIIKRSVRFRQ